MAECVCNNRGCNLCLKSKTRKRYWRVSKYRRQKKKILKQVRKRGE